MHHRVILWCLLADAPASEFGSALGPTRVLARLVGRLGESSTGAPQRARFTAEEGAVFIGIAQEQANSFKGRKDHNEHGVSFTSRASPCS